MRHEPHASPLGADLRGLPPGTIVAAEVDPLTSAAQAYAEKLRAAGVTVDYRLFNSVTHEFFGMGAVVDQARAALEFAATDLRKALGGSRPPVSSDRVTSAPSKRSFDLGRGHS